MISSKIVDDVVDEIFLNTPLLVWLETEVLNARLYHVPAYEHGEVDDAIAQAHYEMSIHLMLAAGYEIDEDIWPPRMSGRPCHMSGDWDDCQVRAVRR